MAQVIVNKSDTFEVQRQKINEIGYDLHTFSGTQIGLNATYITLTDISAVVNSAAAGGNLVYDNSTGQIVYTPPDLSNFITSIGDAIQDADFPSAGLMKTDGSGNYSVVTDNLSSRIALTDIQVTNNSPGNSSLSYNNVTGIFTYTPSDVSNFITLSDLSVSTQSAGTAGLSYNNSTGVLSYTPPDLSSFITSLPTHSIDDHSDVDTTGVADGKILKYDASVSKFVIADDSGAAAINIVDDLTPQLGGNLDVNSKIIEFGDSSGATNNRLKFGAHDDLQIYYDGNTGIVTSFLESDQMIFRPKSTPSDTFITFIDGGPVQLYHGSSTRISTSSIGADISGKLTTDELTVDGDVVFKGANNYDLKWEKANSCLYFYPNAGLKDSTGSKGTADQVLTSNGTTVEWKTRTLENISNVNISSIQTNQILKWDGSSWVNALDSGGSGGGIALGDLSVGTEGSPSGNGGLAYNNLTGQFTFTPAADNSLAFNHANATTSQIIYTNNGAGTPYTLNLIAGTGITFGQGGGTGSLTITGTAAGIGLTDLSVGSNAAASGGGGVAYDNSTGVFTYTPPDLSGYLTGYTETDTLNDVVGRGGITTSNATFAGSSGNPGRLDVQNNGNYAISLNATQGVGINTADGIGLSIGNLATNVWRATIDGSTGDITGNKFVKTSGTSSQFLKADGSVDSNTYLTSISLASSNINDLADVNTGTPTDGHVLKWDSGTSKWISAPDQTASSGSGIALTDLSVTTNAAGTAALSYNNGTGVFSYTPPDLSAVSTDLTAFSVGPNNGATSTGGMSYNNSTGVFSFTPQDLSSYLTSVALNDLTDVTTGTISDGDVLKYSGTNGRWEAQTDETQHLSNIVDSAQGVNVTGKVATTDGVDIDTGGNLNAAGTSVDFQSATISFSGASISGLSGTINAAVDVHLNKSTASSGEVLSWNGTDYDWVAAASGIALSDLSVNTNTAGTAALSYNNATGVFSYTPPDLSTFISLGSISVGSPNTASGTGAISYNNANGVFKYTPPDLSSYLTGSSVIADLNDVVITGSPSSGQVLKWNAATSKWTNQADAAGAGSTDPGGSDTHVQFNDSDSFGGDASLTWDNSNNKLKIGNADSDSYLLVGNNSKRTEIRNNNSSTYLYSYADSTFHIGIPGSGTTIQLDSVSTTMARFVQGAECALYYANTLRFETGDGVVKIHGGLLDKDDEVGEAGQILSTTGGATPQLEWIDAPTPDLAVGDLTDTNITGSPNDNDVLAWDSASSKWTNQAQTGSSQGSAFPSGGIIMWSGSQSNIPSGWVLCDGNNSTPDLRDRFVLGAGSSYSVGDTGGSETVSISTSNMPSHTHTVNSHSHSLPSHSHTVSSHTHSIGSHTHSFSGSGTGTSGVQSDNHYHSGNTSDAGLHNHSYVTHSSLFTGDYHTEAVNANMGNVAATTGDAGTHAHYFDTLGVSEDHTHTTTVSISGTTGAGSGNTGSASPSTSTVSSTNTGATSGSTTGTGGGSALNVMPKYYALCYIMKT
tara:strand:- start:24644 stop:29164 length:4521 start_codon:yes stop_codon:yes gene_type:complete